MCRRSFAWLLCSVPPWFLFLLKLLLFSVVSEVDLKIAKPVPGLPVFFKFFFVLYLVTSFAVGQRACEGRRDGTGRNGERGGSSLTPGSRIGWFSEGPGPRGKKLGVFFFGRVEGRKEGSFPPRVSPWWGAGGHGAEQGEGCSMGRERTDQGQGWLLSVQSS